MNRVILPENAEAFWDGRYAGSLLYGTEPTSVARRLAPFFRSQGVRTILDAGCGSGRDALFYAQEGFAVTGVDLSGQAVRRSQELARSAGLAATFLRFSTRRACGRSSRRVASTSWRVRRWTSSRSPTAAP